MRLSKPLVLCFSVAMMALLPYFHAFAEGVEEKSKTMIVLKNIEVYSKTEESASASFSLYPGMSFEATDIALKEGALWIGLKAGGREFWIKGFENNERTVMTESPQKKTIVDSYGILKLPHQYAAKMVKIPGAEGRLETYEKIDGKYVLNNVYTVTYPREGAKSIYGDLKTVGGPVVRYMYRTLRTGMSGRNQNGNEFGVFKISYPMPQDALPHFLNGHIGAGQYNNIPTVNERNGFFSPHPHSYMGADILIHTARKGSRGCVNIENEAMSKLYREDLTTENDREIIPLVIYDEDMKPPAPGTLF